MINEDLKRQQAAERQRRFRARKAGVPEVPGQKPRLGLPDPLDAAQEEARLAKEGNLKLSRAVDTLRGALETIVIAEMDHSTGLPTTALDLRQLAVTGLNAYSQLTGQNWRKHKLIGSYAGDRNLNTLEG